MNAATPRRWWLRLGLVTALVGTAVLLALTSGISWSQWTPQTVRARILAWGSWAPVIYIVGYTVRVAFLLPASVMTLAGGLLFGPWWGTLYTVIGATLCSALEFGIARWVGRAAIERWLAGRWRLAQFDTLVAKRGFVTVLFIRLIPGLPFDVWNVSLGLSPVRWRDFLLATALGLVPWVMAFGFLGEALTDFRNIWKVLAGILALIAIIWVPWFWRRRQRRTPASPP